MFKHNEEAKKQYELEQENERIITDELEQISIHTKDIEELMQLTERIRDYRNKIYELKLKLRDKLEDIYSEKKVEELTKMKNIMEKDKLVEIRYLCENLIYDSMTMNEIAQIALYYNVYPNTAIYLKLHKLGNSFEYDRHNIIEEGCNINNQINITQDLKECFSNGEYSRDRIMKETTLNKIVNGKITVARYNEQNNKNLVESIREIEEDTIRKINVKRVNEVIKYYEKELLFWQDKYLIESIEMGDSSEHFYE